MKILFGLVFLSLTLFVGCQTPAAVDTFSDADVAAITADLESFTTAMLEGRFSDVAAAYAEDTVFMPPNQENVIGRAAVEAWFEAFPKLGEMEFTDLEVAGTGDLAYATGHYRMTFAPDGENFIEDSGTFLEVRERQEDGSWLIVRDIFNSSLPLPIAE
ncbi:MAG: hypothetical protein BMS9Abin05_0467 [Rhodothermia bacterium]|nr:MAG: hypothetical protein BMS9Abin05_0467 [Rhodothermia bacterium]